MADGMDAAAIIAEATHEAIDAAMAPLFKRIGELEAKLSAPPPLSARSAMIDRDGVLTLTMSDGTLTQLGVVVGKDGRDVDNSALAEMVSERVARAVAPLLDAATDEKAEPVTEAFIAPIIDKAVARAVGAIPVPQNGKDADPEEMRAAVAIAVKEAVAAIPAPKDGRSVTLDDARPVIEAAVKDAVAALPAPESGEDGKDADQDAILAEVSTKALAMVAAIDLAPAVKAAVDAAIADIPPAKDGVGMAGAVIDREGNLVVTMTNGEARSLGPVVGADADMEEIKRIILEGIAALPKAKDGQDGVNWDDLKIEHDGARTVKFRYARGDNSKEFTVVFPAIIYRGVFDKDETYAKGDMTSWDGSLWHCNVEETKARPGVGNSDWVLSVKKGRDGKSYDDPPRPRDPRIRS